MRVLALVLGVGALACGAEEAILRVDLRTDLEPRVEFDTIELTIDGDEVLADAAPAGDYVEGVRIAEIDGVRTGSRELLLRLSRLGEEVAARRAIVAVSRPGTLVTIVVSADCASRVCPGPGDPANATECDFTGCVPPDIEPEPDMGTDPPDAAPPDQGSTDLGPIAMCPDDACLEDDCNGRGWCTGAGCDCDPGHGGARCEECVAPWEIATVRGPTPCAPPNLTDGTEERDNLSASFWGATHLRGFGGNDDLEGQILGDLLEGGAGDDQLSGRDGGDLLFGDDGADELDGDEGDDVLFGGAGDDEVRGGSGGDRLVGGPGNDRLDGDDGDDRFVLDGLGDDRLSDGGGMDTARCAPGVVVTGEAMDGADRVLTFASGGTVRLIRDDIETIVCCRR